MEWATKKQSKRGCANNIGMNGEGHITYAYVKVLCTAEGTRCTAICTFHAEGPFCVDQDTGFFCKVFTYDHNLRALIKDSCFCAPIVYMHPNFS